MKISNWCQCALSFLTEVELYIEMNTIELWLVYCDSEREPRSIQLTNMMHTLLNYLLVFVLNQGNNQHINLNQLIS